MPLSTAFRKERNYSGSTKTGDGEGSITEPGIGVGSVSGKGEGVGVSPGAGKEDGTGGEPGVMAGVGAGSGIGANPGELLKGEAGSIRPPEDGEGRRSALSRFALGSPPPHPARRKHPAVTIFQCAPMTDSNFLSNCRLCAPIGCL